MNIEQLEISLIKPYEKNPRKNDRAVQYVTESLERYGFQQPIVVDKNYKIIVGHTRFKAAKKLNYTHVPVVIAKDLTDEQVKAYRIADNKTNEYADWDNNLLAEEFATLLEQLNDDLSETALASAFSELEIDRLLNGKNYETNDDEVVKVKIESQCTKRIALLCLKKSYVNRGVATYINGWIEWGLRNNVQVDIISNDGDISNSQFDRYQETANWIAPNLVSGQDDDEITMRHPIIRLKDSVDMRTALLSALTQFNYDAIILNTIDNLFTVISMGLHESYKNLYYVTHSETDIGKGPNTFLDPLTKCLLKESGIKIIAQSEYTKQAFIQHTGIDDNLISILCPMLGQPELLENSNQNRKGILYIGPYEDRKNPEVYIKACKQSNKPALLITPSQKSADKFKKRFLEENIEHEIHVALVGKTKADVIKRAALAIIPSKEETFCYTAFEAAHSCRTIIPSNRSWTIAHKDWCILIDEKDIPNHIDEHYNKPQTQQALDALKTIFEKTDKDALALLESDKSNQPMNNAFTKWLDQKGSGSIKEFFQSRPTQVIDEIIYSIKACNHEDYQVTHTKYNTVINLKSYKGNSINVNNLLNLGDNNE